MDLHLKDKVILVTGGAKGIGGAIVRTSHQEGAVPVILDRDLNAGQQLRDQLRAPGNCGLITADLSRPEQCAQAVDETIRTFGRLDALVNNGQHLFVDGGYVHLDRALT
jgi:L-fucose dehydrogenase